jgi:hypothetical protein
MQALTDSSALFGVIGAHHQVVSTVFNTARRGHTPPTPWDLLILLNFIESSSPPRARAPWWTPLCLPESHATAFRHFYISFPFPDSAVFIAIAAANQAAFFDVHAVAEPLALAVEASGALSVRPLLQSSTASV